MKKQRLTTIALAAAMSVGMLVASPVIHAQDAPAPAPKPLGKPKVPVSSILKVGEKTARNAKIAQQKVDKIAAQTGDLLTDYKTLMKQVDGLRIYNERLEKQIAAQIQRIANIDAEIGNASVLSRQMTPLIIRMIDGLEEFVQLDIPFTIEERTKRIAFLRENIDRSDVTVSEKFRQVLEAYKIELEYGRKIESYTGKANVGGSERDVEFFRVGRVALMYQTTDAANSGAWDPKAKQWVELEPGAYRSAIRKGLRISRKEASIDILKTPIQAPEAAQ